MAHRGPALHPLDWLRRIVRDAVMRTDPHLSRPDHGAASRRRAELRFVENQIHDRDGRIERLDAIVRARLREGARK